jgi:hypothetical protein
VTESILWTAQQAAEAINVEVSTFYRMVREGRIPECVQHKATFGQDRGRRYSRKLLELWAAGIDVENLTDDVLLPELLRTALPPAAGWPVPARTEAAS